MSFQITENEVTPTPAIKIPEPQMNPKLIKLKSAGYSIGKQPHNCEDAFFVSERGFGVADGVSGWNDYGFSSHAFAN